LTAFLVLAFNGLASAQVVVNPAKVQAAVLQTFTVSAPNKKDQPMVVLKLLTPASLDKVTPASKPGWKIDVKKASAGKISEIIWSGGSIPAGSNGDFSFSAQVPTHSGVLQWRAYQTFNDGSVASWDASPARARAEAANRGPYSTTRVVGSVGIEPAAVTAPAKHHLWPYAIAIGAILVAVAALASVFWRKR
jgi:uncharacterized protein YcnI